MSPRGWRGPAGSAGGLTRSYGLARYFEKEPSKGSRKPIQRTSVRRVAAYFRPYRKAWAGIFVCIAVSAVVQVLPPFCVRGILDYAIPQADGALLALLAGAMVGLALVGGLIGVLQQTLTTRAGQGIVYDLSNLLYRKLQQMSLHFYTSTRSGEIVSRLNNDVHAVQGVVSGTLVSIVTNVAVLLTTSIALFSQSWRLALLSIVVVPAFYAPARIVGRIRRRLATETAERRSSLMGFMNERLHVSGVMLTNVFGQREEDAASFARETAALRDLNVRQAIVGRWLFMILSVFSALGPAVVYWYGGLQAIREEMTPGGLVAFAALLTLLYRPLISLASVYVDIQGAVAAFDRVFEYLDMEPEVDDRAGAHTLTETRGAIAFENVHFSYPQTRYAMMDRGEDDDAPAAYDPSFALQNLSFQIEPGQRVALVGPSGAGKTTIVQLVPRFYDPAQGRVRLDGHDLRDLSQVSLRQHIGIVAQETFLFHSSLRENLLYARPGATEAEIVEASRAANIHDFIASLPEGYDTVVGERGFRLSGGEKQRVAIARALLKDPAILILDEATSNLDATSEHLIREALERLLPGRTSLIIAHRLSTVLSSDCILVVEDGQLNDAGRHADLLARGGLYATLFAQQFRDVLSTDL